MPADLLARLKPRYPAAAALVERWASAPVAAYRRALWGVGARRAAPLEPILRRAFRAELSRLYGDDPRVGPALATLERHRLLGTTTHLTPASGPVFLAADALLGQGAPAGAVALSGVWTGIPFNNRSLPGSLSFGREPSTVVRRGSPAWRRLAQSAAGRSREGGAEWRVSLVGVRRQNHLVYRHPAPPLLGQTLADLEPAVSRALPALAAGDDYPDWALRACGMIQRGTVSPRLLSVDLNRVMSAYLRAALADDRHPLTRALLDDATSAALAGRFPREPWFYARAPASAGERLVPLAPREGRLVGEGWSMPLSAASLDAALADGTLCPGLLPSYAALCGLNAIVCAGGLRQAEYLPRMGARWRDLGWHACDAGDRPALLLGRLLREGRPAYALDLMLDGAHVDDMLPPDAPMSTLWRPLVDVL